MASWDFDILCKKKKQIKTEYITMTYRVKRYCEFIYISSSSSSCRAISTDIPDPLSPPLPIIYGFRQVLRATSFIYTEVQAGRPAFARPCEGVYRSSSLMSKKPTSNNIICRLY